MMFLLTFSEQPLVHTFGWSLLHFVWEGTIVAALLASVLKLLSGRSPQLRYTIACCALLSMAILPLVTFGYLAITSPPVNHAITFSSVEKGSAVAFGSNFSGAAGSWLDQIAVALNRSLAWMLPVWFAGVILFLGRLNVGLIVARRMKSIATQALPIELHLVFHNLRRRLGIARTVRLANSSLVQVPTVIGWLRPVVLIPVGCLTGLSPVQIEAIFAHELAHIKRHDYLVSVLQAFVEAVLFYHPVVWWVSKQVRRERENCCDDLAVSISGDSLAYAKALSFLEEYRSSYPLVSLGANGGALVMKIRRLLGYKEAPAFSELTGITLLAVVLAAAALGIASFARAQAPTAKQVSSENGRASRSVPLMYQKWLDEDVVWIITPKERAQFMNLSNNDERDGFIKKFWLRGDRKTDGGENNFRTEHYHRIAYANQHFSAGIPGWKTDRGRIFIMYGAPDSIDAHPSAVSATKPYEVWHYHAIQEYAPPEQVQDTKDYKAAPVTKKDIDMKFVDTCSCGNFQLQASPKE